jgi:hypothetical protein
MGVSYPGSMPDNRAKFDLFSAHANVGPVALWDAKAVVGTAEYLLNDYPVATHKYQLRNLGELVHYLGVLSLFTKEELTVAVWGTAKNDDGRCKGAWFADTLSPLVKGTVTHNDEWIKGDSSHHHVFFAPSERDEDAMATLCRPNGYAVWCVADVLPIRHGYMPWVESIELSF